MRGRRVLDRRGSRYAALLSAASQHDVDKQQSEQHEGDQSRRYTAEHRQIAIIRLERLRPCRTLRRANNDDVGASGR